MEGAHNQVGFKSSSITDKLFIFIQIVLTSPRLNFSLCDIEMFILLHICDVRVNGDNLCKVPSTVAACDKCEFSPLTAAAAVTLLGPISCLALLTSLSYNVHSPHLLSLNEPIVSVHLHNHPFSSRPSTLTFWFPRRPTHCSFHTFLLLPTRGLPSPSLPGFVGC